MHRVYLTLTLLMAAPSLARTETVNFDYSWKLNDGSVSLLGQGAMNVWSMKADDGQSFTANFGGNEFTFWLAPAGSASANSGGLDLFGEATQILMGKAVFTAASDVVKGSFTYGANLDLTLTLKDPISQESVDIPVYIGFSGDTSSNMQSISTYATNWWGGSRFTPLLGGYSYLVNATPSWAAVQPGESLALNAEVFVGGADAGVGPVWLFNTPELRSVPEPSSLLLGGCALVLVGAVRLRRRTTQSTH